MSDGRGWRDRRVRVAALAVLLALSPALAGCSLAGAGTPAPPTGAEAAERIDRLDGVRVSLNVTRRLDGNASWAVNRIATRPTTGDFRSEVVATGPPSPGPGGTEVGSLVVSNGSVRYIYTPGAERVFRSTVDGPNASGRAREVRRLFEALGGRLDRPPALGPLPTVPPAENDSVSWRETPVTVDYRGVESVAGRSAFVVHLEPTVEDTSMVESTLWLDREYLYPLRGHRVFVRQSGRYDFTSVAEEVAFDPAFEPGTFEFDPATLPGDPTVVATERYDSREAVAAALDRPVPDPETPPGFEFRSATRSDGDHRDLHLRYANGRGESAESIRIHVTDRPGDPAAESDRTVTVAGRELSTGSYGDRDTLSWSRGEWRISVTGDVDRATLRGVAASVLRD